MAVHHHAADPSASGLRIDIAVADFYDTISQGLLEGALHALGEAGCEDVGVYRVGGAFELPLLCRQLAAGGADGVVALGAVIEGETDHYTYVADAAATGLLRAGLDTGVPIGFGILTVRTAAHAEARSAPGPGNKGAEAAEAVVVAANALRAARAR